MTLARLREIFSLRDNVHSFVTPPRAQNGVLDGFRALPTLYVVLFHAFYLPQPAFREFPQFIAFVQSVPSWFNWIWHGDVAVDMFLILSGFLIASLMLRDRERSGEVRAARFYGHRALRILPAYLLAVALAAPGHRNGSYFWANLLFVNNLLPLEKMLIPWSWSLSIEVQFYVLFPLLLVFLLRSRHPLRWLAALFLGSIAVTYAVVLANPDLYRTPLYLLTTKQPGSSLLYFEKIYVNLHTRVAPLLLGVTMAWIAQHHGAAARAWLARHARACGVLGVIALLVVVALVQTATFDPAVVHGEAYNLHYLALAKPVFALAMAFLLWLAMHGAGAIGRPLQRLLALRLWYPVAQASYSMYLFHIPFVYVAYYLLLGGKVEFTVMPLWMPFAVFAMAVPCSLAFSFLIYLFVERPFINLYRGSHRPAAQAT